VISKGIVLQLSSLHIPLVSRGGRAKLSILVTRTVEQFEELFPDVRDAPYSGLKEMAPLIGGYASTLGHLMVLFV
jgi:hypothetical protein